MPRFFETQVASDAVSHINVGNDSRYVVQSAAGSLYYIYSAQAGGVFFRKSTNNGLTWSPAVTINAATGTYGISVWFDRWSNIAAGLIHIAYYNTTDDDVLYRTIDTERSDALSTETVILAGTSAAQGGALSITRAVGGNVYCRAVIDSGVEGGFFRLANANVPNGAWDAARTNNEALAADDMMILLPNQNSADNQDIYGIFWDVSANEISRQNYDDSANTWAETSISTGMVDQNTRVSGMHYAATVDIANSQTVLIAWNGIDTANADLLCWTITESAVTAKTDVVTNGTDDQGLAAIGINTTTGYWHAFYGGKSDGSEDYLTDINIYQKISTDSGTTWGAEQIVTTDEFATDIVRLFCAPRFTGDRCPVINARLTMADTGYDHVFTAVATQPRAQLMLGV